MTDSEMLAELKRLELAMNEAFEAAEGDPKRHDNLLRAMNCICSARDLLIVGPDRGGAPDESGGDEPLVH